MKLITRLLFLLAVLGATAWSLQVPPAEDFQNPDLARIVFFHLPCALVCSLFIVAAPVYAFRSVRSKDAQFDVKAVAAVELAFVLGVLTLLTGMIFSDVQWGYYWSWDPRQTSFLLVQLIMGAYFALRAAFPDPAKRAANSAAYLLAAVLPILFLIFVYPRLPQVQSLHPNVIQEGGFDSTYRNVFLTMLALMLTLCVWIYRLRVRAGLLELAAETYDAKLADRDDSSAPRVVRPVPVPPEGGATRG